MVTTTNQVLFGQPMKVITIRVPISRGFEPGVGFPAGAGRCRWSWERTAWTEVVRHVLRHLVQEYAVSSPPMPSIVMPASPLGHVLRLSTDFVGFARDAQDRAAVEVDGARHR